MYNCLPFLYSRIKSDDASRKKLGFQNKPAFVWMRNPRNNHFPLHQFAPNGERVPSCHNRCVNSFGFGFWERGIFYLRREDHESEEEIDWDPLLILARFAFPLRRWEITEAERDGISSSQKPIEDWGKGRRKNHLEFQMLTREDAKCSSSSLLSVYQNLLSARYVSGQNLPFI